MPDTTTQTHRIAAVGSPLGDDVLLFHALAATDALGRLYEYALDVVSEDLSVDFAAIVGQPVTVRVNLHDGSPRYFTGYVARFSQTSRAGALAHYSAVVVPWLWFLTRSADCRIFQGQATPDILKAVFADYPAFADAVDARLSGTYAKWDYCVQYRETDFDFVSRLMEREGIYYFFAHAEDGHKLVLCDGPAAHHPVPGYESIAYRRQAQAFDGTPHVSGLTVDQEVTTGRYTHTDFDFTTPRKSLRATATPADPPANDYADLEVYDYPGQYTDPAVGKRSAQVRLDERLAGFETVRGTCDSRAVACGSVLSLTNYPRDDRNRDYLVTGVTHRITGDEYQAGNAAGNGTAANRGGTAAATAAAVHTCTFTAVSRDEPFRPARTTPKPFVRGPQTAIVVGPAGQEVYVDGFGRVKVQFHWDRVGKRDQDSSCWIRVGQPTAGRRWGSSFWPRIGQEVVVSFLEGDPDRPIVTNTVYNGDNKPPYLGDGPDPKHGVDPKLSGFKTNSTPGGKGFNELRFDDSAGKEQVFLRSQGTLDVRCLGTSNETVGGDHNTTIGWEKDGQRGGDHRQLVHQDQHLTVERDQFEHVGGNAQLLVGKGPAGGGGNLDVSVEKQKTETVGQGSDLHVVADRREKIDGSASLTVGGSQQAKVGQRHAVDAGQEIHLKAGMNVVIEAGLELTIKAAGGFISIGPAGVTIQGTMVLINSGGAAGSGGGSSPDAPTDAKEASPTPPAAADEAKTGQASTQLPPPPPKTTAAASASAHAKGPANWTSSDSSTPATAPKGGTAPKGAAPANGPSGSTSHTGLLQSLDDAAKAVAAGHIGDAISDLGKAATGLGTFAGDVGKIGGELGKAAGEVSSVGGELKKLGGEAAKLGGALTKDAKEVTQATGKFDKIAGDVGKEANEAGKVVGEAEKVAGALDKAATSDGDSIEGLIKAAASGGEVGEAVSAVEKLATDLEGGTSTKAGKPSGAGGPKKTGDASTAGNAGGGDANAAGKPGGNASGNADAGGHTDADGDEESDVP